MEPGSSYGGEDAGFEPGTADLAVGCATVETTLPPSVKVFLIRQNKETYSLFSLKGQSREIFYFSLLIKQIFLVLLEIHRSDFDLLLNFCGNTYLNMYALIGILRFSSILTTQN